MLINRLNNFGFLRLLFAYLVILGRSPEMIDGNVQRDILYLATGTLPLGDLAVDGFFLISGYLICQSFENSKSFFNYLAKRILRIYPAFIIVWILTFFVLVPLAGGLPEVLSIEPMQWLKNLLKMFILSEPFIDGYLLLDNNQTLNGALWTIRYEFLCYMFIPFIALFGLSKKSVAWLAVVFLSTYVLQKATGINYATDVPFTISLSNTVRLASAFLVGMLFYQFRDKVVWSRKILAVCLLLILLTITNPIIAEACLLLFGGYVMFYFSFSFKNDFIQNCNVKNDISYGVYIYAWPIQALLITYYQIINPWLLTILTAIIVIPFGYLSWKLIEEPSLKLKNKI